MELLQGQPFPGIEENIEYLVTFGSEAPKSWGDDDHSQVVFCSVPTSQSNSIFIRIFDADVGGKIDEVKSGFDAEVRYMIIGGKGAFTHPDSKNTDPVGQYKIGNIIKSKTFGVDPRYDGKWYTFGPINPREGERVNFPTGERFVFKIIIEGIKGDDGNLYKIFLSSLENENLSVEGGDAFTYEYAFRVPSGISHVYPYIDHQVTTIQQYNFDFDYDGYMRLISAKRFGERLAQSKDNAWASSKFKIYEVERGKSLEVQMISNSSKKNNNMVLYLTNQYGESMPFYSSPIGGKPSPVGIKAEEKELNK